MQRHYEANEKGYLLTVTDGTYSHTKQLCKRTEEWEIPANFASLEREAQQLFTAMREGRTYQI